MIKSKNIGGLLKQSVFFAGIVLMASCSLFHKKKEVEAKPIARVFDAYLYPNDITGLVPKGSKTADSITIVKGYIDHWMEEQVLLHQATTNLTEKQMDLSKQIEDYKNSLIIYAYEKELVHEKLDTNVDQAEIEKYYDDNKKDFELKNDIVKIIYVKTGKKTPGLDKLKAMMTSDNPKDRDKLLKFCAQYAENSFLNDNAWLMFDDVLKEVPIQTYNQDLFLQNNNNHFVQIEDSTSVYSLCIKGYEVKNNTSPLSFERENIKKILLNQRKMKLIEDVKKSLYQDALNHNNTQVY